VTAPLESFRLAMRKLAASVHVITAGHDGARGGLTATAVCSVSFEPMVMLACIHRSVSCFDMIEQSGKFAVNLLSTQDVAIAEQFGSHARMDERFTTGDWDAQSGVPILQTAAATILLDVASHHDSGTHRVYFGNVDQVTIAPERTALLYEDGGFCSTGPLRSAV
jgi:flavin reductase (DIM6/NTAB) family NADH-FMN oxidoreductase RutF